MVVLILLGSHKHKEREGERETIQSSTADRFFSSNTNTHTHSLSHSISFVMQNNVYASHAVGRPINNLICCMWQWECICLSVCGCWNLVLILIWYEYTAITVIVVRDVTDSKFTHKPDMAFVYHLKLTTVLCVHLPICREFSLVPHKWVFIIWFWYWISFHLNKLVLRFVSTLRIWWALHWN